MHRSESGVGVSHAPRPFETEMAARYFVSHAPRTFETEMAARCFERPVAQPRPQGAFPWLWR